MLNGERVAELTLVNNRRLRFTWYPSTQSLYVELQEPNNNKHGHGFGFVDGVSLQGAELRAFTEAIAALQEPELLPAA
jgi:hypothetical protein